MSPATSARVHRLVAAVALLAVVASGIPVAAAMPAACAECCNHAAVRAADGPLPDCCRAVPADRPIGREAAAAPQTSTPRAVAFAPSPARHAAAQVLNWRAGMLSSPQRHAARTECLRI